MTISMSLHTFHTKCQEGCLSVTIQTHQTIPFIQSINFAILNYKSLCLSVSESRPLIITLNQLDLKYLNTPSQGTDTDFIHSNAPSQCSNSEWGSHNKSKTSALLMSLILVILRIFAVPFTCLDMIWLQAGQGGAYLCLGCGTMPVWFLTVHLKLTLKLETGQTGKMRIIHLQSEFIF